jgi:DNA-binding IclR family transcriptional regulator
MKSLDKVLDIIEFLAINGHTGIREISAKLSVPPATVHRIVASLNERGYLQKKEDNQQYGLSTKFLELGDAVQQQFDIVSIARPFLEYLVDKTGENANLCILNGWNSVYIDHIHSKEHSLMLFTRLGAAAPLYASGVGKIFLSYFSISKLKHYFNEVECIAYTDDTIITLAEMRLEIEKIQQIGYAFDDEEKEKGVRCVAAPILDRKGKNIAGISVSGATQRISVKRLSQLGEIVKETAQQLSGELGYDSPSLDL